MKIFIGPGVSDSSTLFFEMDPHWEIVGDTDQAEIFVTLDNHNGNLGPLLELYRPHQVLLVLAIFHISEGMGPRYYGEIKEVFKSVTDKVIVMHTNLQLQPDNMVYFDHMFDRQKLYCTEYDRGIKLYSRLWTTSCAKEIYCLHPINKISYYNKFLAPIRVYALEDTAPNEHSRMFFRHKLKEILRVLDNTHTNDGALLLPDGLNADVLMVLNRPYGGSWYPVSHAYYDSSFVSIYTESLVSSSYGQVSMLTEKTFDPLIRGNFVLPFGYSGLIQDIRNYGFLLPDWIDYSYDSIIDNIDRFDAYVNSLRKLDKYSVREMYDLSQKDKGILEHNRSLFFSRPYDYPNVHGRVTACIKTNEEADWKLC